MIALVLGHHMKLQSSQPLGYVTTNSAAVTHNGVGARNSQIHKRSVDRDLPISSKNEVSMSVTSSDETTGFTLPNTSVDWCSSRVGRFEHIPRALSAWRARAAERRAWRTTADAMAMADLGPPLAEIIREISTSC